jgi:hypothetical protein
MVVSDADDIQEEVAERSHRISVGDTLAKLAERYLGDASRSAEIFEANTNLLNDPRVLPIGVWIQIPPKNQTDKAQAVPEFSSRWTLEEQPGDETGAQVGQIAESTDTKPMDDSSLEPIPPEALPPRGYTPWSHWGR